jgi:hypothetical protein
VSFNRNISDGIGIIKVNILDEHGEGIMERMKNQKELFEVQSTVKFLD